MPTKLSKEAPLVFMLHDHEGSNKDNPDELVRLGSRDGFAVCVPLGLSADSTDFIGFIIELAKYLQEEYHLNPLKTFCAGYSSGGDMCYMIANNLHNPFAAIVSVSGYFSEKIYKSKIIPHPIPIMIVYGTNDTLATSKSKYSEEKDKSQFLTIPMTVRYWSVVNRCTHETVELLPQIGRQIILHHNHSCITTPSGMEAEVSLYEIIGGEHEWPDNDMETYWEIGKFFKILK
jgi:polyhydroxybutyrate depolymerase